MVTGIVRVCRCASATSAIACESPDLHPQARSLPVNDSHDARSLPLRAPTPCKARAWSRDPLNERLSLGDSRNRHRLFLTKESEFAGDNQHLTVEETMQHTSGLSVL